MIPGFCPGMTVQVKKTCMCRSSASRVNDVTSVYAGHTGIVADHPPVPGFDIALRIDGWSASFTRDEVELIGWV